ncbi:MAG: outer membrane beta-barrel protein [Candidatus Sulfotelmatobacter sp.]
MTRFTVAAFVSIFLICSFGFAQDTTPKVQVFAGYSLLHLDTVGMTSATIEFALLQPANTLTLRTNLNGWSGEAQYNANRWFGVAADIGGEYGGPVTANSGATTGVPNGNSYSFLAGPVLTYRKKPHVTPYVHAVFGWNRASLSASTVKGPINTVPTNAENYTGFVMALGGGLDYKLTQRFSLRLAQLDWFHTSVNFNKFYGNAFSSDQFQGFSTHQDNLRFSTGVVVRF